ncbi:MAG: hypothetical protein R3F15_18385 [Lysobacterales bacterium]
MLKVKVLGLDLAKRVVQACVLDEHDKVRKNAKLSPVAVNLPPENGRQEAQGHAACSTDLA